VPRARAQGHEGDPVYCRDLHFLEWVGTHFRTGMEHVSREFSVMYRGPTEPG
jgi:hypothetical protein